VIVVVPAFIPVTLPDASIVPFNVLLLAQVPPPASVSAVTLPIHTDNVPAMFEGSGLTVTTVVAWQLDGAGPV
jgi:hypothetical protein